MNIPTSVFLVDPFFFDAGYQLGKFSKMPEFFTPALGIRSAGGRQDVDSGSVERFFLDTVFALALGKLFVSELPVECHYVWRKLLELLRKYDAALGKIFTLQFFDPFRRAFHEIRKSNAEFDDSLVVVVIEGLRDHTTCIEHGPKLIRAAGVIVAHAHGRFAWVTPDDYELHAFAKMVRECSHQFSLLCLLDEVSPHQNLCARFDIGSQGSSFNAGAKPGRPYPNHYAAMTYEGKAFAQSRPEIFRPKL
jgi:hypothetical protein